MKYTINTADNWRLYTDTVPQNAEPLGTVTRDGVDTGALVRFTSTGLYAQVNAGVIRSLDGRKVSAALGPWGRPKEINDGKRINIYLGVDDLEKAAEIGGGNVSAGIRIALQKIVLAQF